jgi:hypothetical protein
MTMPREPKYKCPKKCTGTSFHQRFISDGEEWREANGAAHDAEDYRVYYGPVTCDECGAEIDAQVAARVAMPTPIVRTRAEALALLKTWETETDDERKEESSSFPRLNKWETQTEA